MQLKPSVWLTSLIMLAVASGGCQSEDQRQAERRRVEQDRSSPAFKAGQAAHEIARKAESVAAEAGRKLGEGARKAHEGWKEEDGKGRGK